MLDSLKEAGKNLGHEIGRAWDVVSDGWRELYSRSSNALTHFSHPRDANPPPGAIFAPFPRWSLLASELEETDKEIVVRIELPGMDKKDCQLTVEGNRLLLSGRKHFERSSDDSQFHVMERAYGAFQRSIALPKNVREELAEASYLNGVLTVRLPKQETAHSRSIPVD